jgi:hypothetical protein
MDQANQAHKAKACSWVCLKWGNTTYDHEEIRCIHGLFFLFKLKMIFTTSKIIKRFKVSPKQLLIWSNRHKLNIWVSSLMWIPPLQESIWLKDDKKKKSKKEARDTTNAYLASACCPMLCSWNLSRLVSLVQSGKCSQNGSVAWKCHDYTASQTFLLQRKKFQKTEREVVQQTSRQAQVLLIILRCSFFLYMQLSLGWVCVLHQKLLITVNCCFKCTYVMGK